MKIPTTDELEGKAEQIEMIVLTGDKEDQDNECEHCHTGIGFGLACQSKREARTCYRMQIRKDRLKVVK